MQGGGLGGFLAASESAGQLVVSMTASPLGLGLPPLEGCLHGDLLGGSADAEAEGSMLWRRRRREEEEEEEMAQQSKEPCKKEACDIQACLSKNMFDSKKCVRVIQLLQSCCEQCEYKSTHCGSLTGLLKNISK